MSASGPPRGIIGREKVILTAASACPFMGSKCGSGERWCAGQRLIEQPESQRPTRDSSRGRFVVEWREEVIAMRAVAFQSELRADRTLSVPEKVAGSIPQGQPVQVLVLVAEDVEDQTWEQMAAADFGLGYADSDAIYDDLPSR